MIVENFPVWLLLVNFALPILLWVLKDSLLKYWTILTATLQVVGVGYTLAALNDPTLATTLNLGSSAGLSLSFWTPAWTLLFLALIWGIGALILIYAYGYFGKDTSAQRRSLALLTLFMASMQAMVMSENLLLLFIFWEMTTLCSFLMIGHSFEKEEARKSALQALYVTGAGGLSLLLGLLFIWDQQGTLSLRELIHGQTIISPYAFALIAIGALAKSAQFPLHFWLPGAMAAPTPISAYLHSATMVKAGLFLIGLMSVITPKLEWISFTFTLIGGITAIWGGVIALFQHDLKKLLAYTTVSALGMILVALAPNLAFTYQAAALFILVHAFYKAGLFMLIGWIDQNYHTRDVALLGGLRSRHPFMMGVTLILCLSMAGLAPTIGYFGKETLYVSLLEHSLLGTFFLFIASVLSAAAAYQIFSRLFLGKMTPQLEAITPHHQKNIWTTLGPATLAFGSLLLVFFIGPIAQKLLIPIAPAFASLELHWIPHSMGPIILTVLTFVCAFVLVISTRKYFHQSDALILKVPTLSNFFDSALALTMKMLSLFSHLIFKGGHQRHLILGLCASLALLVLGLTTSADTVIKLPYLETSPEIWEIALFTLIAMPAASIPFIQGRVSALLVGSATGLGICLLFALYSAPDLALTQLIVETLVLVMFVYSVKKLPKVFLTRSFAPHYFQLFLAMIFASLLTLIVSSVYYLQTQDRIWHFFAENSLIKGFGRNVVNVILVDFRALDTMGEITVLALASVGVFALLRPAHRDNSLVATPQNIWSVKIALKFLVPTMLALSIYLLLRGHNAPGGGFIGGLVAGLSLVMHESTPRLGRPFRLLFIGLGLSLLSGMAPLLFGLDFFTAIWGPALPGGIKLGTVLTFDLGVFILVIGMVLLISRLLSRKEEATS